MATSLPSTSPSTNMETQPSESDEEELSEVLEDLGGLDLFHDGEDLTCKRQTCQRCKRPITVCYCPYLPKEEINIITTLYILQHPFEESRCLRTIPILQNCVPQDKCKVFRGKHFNFSKWPELEPVFQAPNTLLLYPGKDAVDIQDLPRDQSYNLVLLDGTWAQAKGMYNQNPQIRGLKKVQIQVDMKSKYVIRTQPCDSALSSLETAAIAISTLEQRPEIAQILTHPLVALCDFQLQHGALEHQSRQFKVENGLWTKPLPRSVQRRLERKKAQAVT